MVKRKIIFFVRALERGGIERVISELSLNLPHTIEKIIVTLVDQTSYPYNIKGKIISLGLPSNSKFSFATKIRHFFVGMARLRKLIKKEKPNYVISFGSRANMMNIFSCRQNILGIDDHISSEPMPLYKAVAKIFFNKVPRFICVAKVAAKDLVDNFGVEEKNIKVIYNPLNIKEITALSKEPIEPEYRDIFNHPVIINIGRFVSQKGQWYLIRAFSEVKKKIKDAQLVILGGQGNLEKELKQLAKDLGVEKEVHFLGWQKNPFKLMVSAKVFVLPSLWEGFGIVLIEALACGLPVISADCKAGPREILAPKTDINYQTKDIEYAEYGILTPVFSGKKYGATEPLERSEEILRDAIIKVLTDKKVADNLSRESFQRASDFDIAKIIKEWDFLEK